MFYLGVLFPFIYYTLSRSRFVFCLFSVVVCFVCYLHGIKWIYTDVSSVSCTFVPVYHHWTKVGLFFFVLLVLQGISIDSPW